MPVNKNKNKQNMVVVAQHLQNVIYSFLSTFCDFCLYFTIDKLFSYSTGQQTGKHGSEH